MSNKKDLFNNLEMEEHIKIPSNRIGVLIGIKGVTKATIEEKTQTILTVDSSEGLVTIKPKNDIENPLLVWTARDIIKAIARGFSEEKAFKLLDEDYFIDILTLDYEKERLRQIRGRIIGEGGRTRKIIELSTSSFISVQGKTIAIIALIEELPVARKAIDMLLDGHRHSTIYKFLENHRIQKKKEETEIWQKKIELKDNIE